MSTYDFTRLDKKTLSIPASSVGSYYGYSTTVERVTQNRHSVFVRNKEGYEGWIPLHILSINNQSFEHKTLTLSSEMFKNYLRMSSRITSKLASVDLRIGDRLGAIIENLEWIINDPRFYLLRPESLFGSGGAWGGRFGVCLGAWLEGIDREPRLKVKVGKDEAYLMKIAGSPLSGVNKGTLWLADRRRIITKDNAVDSFSTAADVLRSLGRSCTLSLSSQSEIEYGNLLLKELAGYRPAKSRKKDKSEQKGKNEPKVKNRRDGKKKKMNRKGRK